MPVSAITPSRETERTTLQQTEVPRPTKPSEADKLRLKEEREEKIKLLQCEAAKTRLESQKEVYEAQQLRYGNRYVNMLTRLNSLLEKLEEREYDTLNLPEYVDELTVRVEEFNSDLKDLVGKFDEMRPVTCTTSSEEYLRILREAKTESAQLRTRSREINQYFLDTILPELKRVRAQVEADKMVEPTVEVTPESPSLTN
jgi:hypothetical protein